MRHVAPLLLALALLEACRIPAAGAWVVADADVRIPVTVRGDLYARAGAAIETVIDFNALLGGERTVAAGSLRLIEPETGSEASLDLAEDRSLAHASGNPVLRLRWSVAKLGAFEQRRWDLYLRTTVPADPSAWQPLEQTFARTGGGCLLATSFEDSDPTHPDRPKWYIPGGKDEQGETTERVWSEHGARSGLRCLKIARTFEGEPPTNSNRPHWRTWPPPISVAGGQALRVTGWLKAPRLEPGAIASLSIEFYGPDNRRLSEGRLRLTGDRLAHDWVPVSGATTAPGDAEGACLWFSLHGSGEAYCDDVTATSIPGATLPPARAVVGEIEHRADVAPPQDDKLIRCGIAEAPPNLDGVLDDACWAAATAVEDFAPFIRVPGSNVGTIVRACADEKAIYFAFECIEPTTEGLRAAAEGRDGRVWADDSVELFLDTNRDRRSYYQFIVNPAGVVFDQDTGAEGLAGPEWDGPITVGTKVSADRWFAEVRLGLEGLRLAEADGSRWGANFARTSLREGRSCYTWARVEKGFGEPAHFGTLLLPFDPTVQSVTGRALSAGTLFWGPGHLQIEVNNRRARSVEVRVAATAILDAGERNLGEQLATVAPESAATVSLEAVLDHTGPLRVRYDVTDAIGGELLYTLTQLQSVPEPLELSASNAVGYVGEQWLCGRWRLGVADGELSGYRIVLQVVGADGGAAQSRSEAVPDAAEGDFVIPVGGLPAGAYHLEAVLMAGGAAVASRHLRIERIVGPFDDGRGPGGQPRR